MNNSHYIVLKTCLDWLRAGYAVELITVLKTWGSSPRPPGSIAVVRDDGAIAGSVSGGCIEKQLSEQFRVRDLPRVHTHRVDDEQAKRYGLACGGELELLFESVASAASIEPLLEGLQRRQRVKRVIDMKTHTVAVGPANKEDTFEWNQERLVQVFGAGYRLLLVGAGELSRFTARFAMSLDFEVFVVDPREHFRQAWSEPDAALLSSSPDDAVIHYASDARSAVVALSHDPNIDDLALIEALPSDAFYVGALGSRRSQKMRVSRLSGLDVSDKDIARLKGPVGLDINARTSAEIAISIIAELIQVRSALSVAGVVSTRN
ncbi:MAG: XdhC family protein [Granulosicoccus sp.]|nr:XdhC family protein [Granulosicoccus sp.]